MSFLKPKIPAAPKIVAPPPTPTIDEAAVRAEDEMRIRRRRGRGAYVVAGKNRSAAPTVATKQLTGQ
jgi:hypothetical protein